MKPARRKLIVNLRQSYRYNLIVTSARSIMGSGLVVDHQASITAISHFRYICPRLSVRLTPA